MPGRVPNGTLPNTMNITCDGMPSGQRALAFLAVILGIGVTLVDQSATNMLLPTLAQDFGASPSSCVFIVNLYQLTIAVCLVPLASLGGSIGFNRIYLSGLLVTAVSSLACSLARDMTTLAVLRCLQGVAAAGVMSVNLALLRHIFPAGKLGRAVGGNATVVAFAATVGPVLAGFLATHFSWRWMFALDIPVALLSFGIGFKSLPGNTLSKHPFDWTSAALSMTTFGAFILCMAGLGQGFPAPVLALLLLAAATACLVLIRRERHAPEPMLPVDLLRIPMLALALVTSTAAFITQMLIYVTMPFLLQTGLGFSAAQAGSLFAPWPLALAVAGPIAGTLTERYRPEHLCCLGLTLLASGAAALALLPQGATAFDVAWRMALCGFGFGFFSPPNNTAVIGASPRHRSGGASSALGTARMLGQSCGAALAALGLATAHASALLWLAAGVAGVSLVMCLFRRPIGSGKD